VPCVTFPSDDPAFREHVRRLAEEFVGDGPAELQERLARLFPRVVVRARGLSSEPEVWYVYRDGSWRSPSVSWWDGPLVPYLVLDHGGWVTNANLAARSLLGMRDGETHHYSDFLAPGTTDAALTLFQVVLEGHPLSATLLLRPVGGDLIACEVRAERHGDGLRGWLRLAEDVDVDVVRAMEPVASPALRTEPSDDVVFAAYAERQLASMSDPSPAGLALRLRRLFPHARVTTPEHGRWVARRDGHPRDATAWWQDDRLPRVRFDDRGLILEANQAATELLGWQLAGRHWQELVTPGSHEQVQPVLDMLRAAGEVVSRFRIPAADGCLVEFDSHTRVDGDDFITTMRPGIPAGTDDGDAPPGT
jgi:PAS domain-containing protein